MIRECNMAIQPSNDDLMHWKYKYKKKDQNGKWRYYYDVGPSHVNYVNNPENNSNIQGYTKFQDMLGLDEREAAYRWHQQFKKDREAAHNNKNKPKTERYSPKTSKAAFSGKQYYESLERYKRTPIGIIDTAKRSYANAIDFVANAIGSAANKLKDHSTRMRGDTVSIYGN